MKRWIGIAAMACSLAWPAVSEGSNIGISVDGNLAFEFGIPNANYFSNSTAVVAEPLVEFSYHSVAPDSDGGSVTTDATANFTAQQLIVTYSIVGFQDLTSPWTMTFTSAGFSNLKLSEVSDTLGVTGSLQGNQLTITWPGSVAEPGAVPTAVFNFSATAVPEPATLLLLATGLGAAALRRGRRVRS